MPSVRAHVIAFFALAALVAAELALKRAQVSPSVTALLLGGLALANFAGVVAFHMNLRTAPRGLKLLFVVPLVFPALFAVALVADAMAHGVRP
jgi:hypothetical protein